MVSPRKPRIVLRRLCRSPKNNGSSPEDWISASDFQFAEFPAIPAMEANSSRPSTGRGARKPALSGKAQIRRHSVLLKRLDLTVNSGNVSPLSNVRKTRRQSIAITSTFKLKEAIKPSSPEKLKVAVKPTSPNKLKATVKPSSPNKLKVVAETSSPELKITAKPPPARQSSSKLEPSDPKIAPERKRMSRSSSCNVVLKSPSGKRKMNSEISSNKMETSSKKMNLDVPKIAPAKKPSPNKKRILRSAIPKRAVRSCVLLASPLNKQKAPDSPKTMKVIGKINVDTPKTPKKEAKVEGSPIKRNNIAKTPKKETKVEGSPIKKNIDKTPQKETKVEGSLIKRKNIAKTPQKQNKVESSPRTRNSIAKTPQKKCQLESSPRKGSKIAVKKNKSPVSQKIQGNHSLASPRKEKKNFDKEIKASDSLEKERKTPILTRGMKRPLVKNLGSPDKSKMKLKAESPKSEKKLKAESPKMEKKLKAESPKREKKLKAESPKSKMILETVCLTSSGKGSSVQSRRQLSTPQKSGVKTPAKLQKRGESRSQTPSSKQQKNMQSPQKRASRSSSKMSVISQNSCKPSLDKKSTLSESPKSPVKKLPTTVTDSPLKKDEIKTPMLLKRLGSPTYKSRITRSSARKVTLIGKSPKNFVSSFRKTPKSKRKSLQEDEPGASPVLTARAQLELIRSRSPLRSQQKNVATKMNPYTPRPDSPPSHVLRKTMKKKVAKKMYATTKVEVHQLMNGDISQPVKFTSGSKSITASVTLTQTNISTAGEAATVVTPRKSLSKNISDDIPGIFVTASTPGSASGLPPTPKSSRKKSDFMKSIRTLTSQTSGIVSCQQSLSLATPRSSTPIEQDEEEILEPVLNVDAVIQPMDKESGFADVTINDDLSEDEISSFELDKKENQTPEKKKRSYCALM